MCHLQQVCVEFVIHRLQHALHMSLIHSVYVKNDDLTHESNIRTTQQLASLHESGATPGCTAERSTLPLSQSTALSGRCSELHQKDWHVPDKVSWCQRLPVTFRRNILALIKCERCFCWNLDTRSNPQSNSLSCWDLHKSLNNMSCPPERQVHFKRLRQIRPEHFTGVTLSNYCQVLKTTTTLWDINLHPCSYKQIMHTWFGFITFV